MIKTQINYDEFCAKILQALAFLDQKGINDNVSKAITIVYEGFRRQAANLPFTADDLLLSAITSESKNLD